MIPPGRALGERPDTRGAYRDVLRIALPSVAEMVFMSLIGSVDTMMVGGLGAQALAAVGLAGQPRMILLCMFFAINIGVTAIVARRKGEGRREDANRTLRNALTLVVGLSLIVMALALALAKPLMRLAGGEEQVAGVLEEAAAYFSILALSLPVHAMALAINAAQRGIGNTAITLRVNIVSNLVNVVFNYLLIGGNLGFPRLGVRGAAIASVIGIAAGALLALRTILFQGRHDAYLHVRRGDSFRPDGAAMRAIVRVGGNAMIEQVALRVGFFAYARIVAGLGTEMFAAHQICIQFLNISFTFGDGIAVAATSLVGQRLGGGRPDLAMLYGKVSQRLALVAAAALASALSVFRYPLAGLFINASTQNAAVVIEAAAQVMLVVAGMQLFQTSAVVFCGCLRGAGDNLFVAGMMTVCVSIVRPLCAAAAVYAFHLGLVGAWLSGMLELALRLALSARRFASGRWQNKKV